MKKNICLLILLYNLIFSVALFAKKISIISPYGIHPAGIELFGGYNNEIRDEVNKPFYELKNALLKKGYEVIIASRDVLECKDSDHIIFFGPDISLVRQLDSKAKKICFCFEPPLIAPNHFDKKFAGYFEKIFLLLDDTSDNNKYYKFFYPQPDLSMISDPVPYNKKKLCTLIAGARQTGCVNDLYCERINSIRFFESSAPHDFDFYGIGWPPSVCYKGLIKHKKPVLRNYKFCLCYENSRHNGYITEKIFDAMVAGCVPVYWGAYNIAKYIPDNCFVDRAKFKSNSVLYSFLQQISEEQYNKYLLNIRNFLKSPGAGLFSTDYFVRTILDLLS